MTDIYPICNRCGKSVINIQFAFLKTVLLLSLLTACSRPNRPEQRLTAYDPVTAPFAACSAAPWPMILERAQQTAMSYHPNAELLAIFSSPRSAIGYADEFIIRFEFRVIFEPVDRTDASEPAPVITVEVPECTLEATRVLNTATTSPDHPALPASFINQIQIGPRAVFEITKPEVELWLGRSIEPHDIGNILIGRLESRDLPQDRIPRWSAIYYDNGSTDRRLSAGIDVQSGTIIDLLKIEGSEIGE